MSWKRYFRAVGTPGSVPKPTVPGSANERGGAGTSSKFSSYLPEVYAGHPNRIQRYYQYDDMDRDSDINAALDIIADFCTQSEEQIDEPFTISYSGEPNETEVSLLRTALTKWTKLNEFRSRLWHMFRSVIKNGDAFFLRDPETAEWLWIDSFMVEMVKVDDSIGKEPDEYMIRGLDFNKQARFATAAADPSQFRSPFGASNAGGARPQAGSQSSGVFSLAGSGADPHNRGQVTSVENQLSVVEAEHVVHLSLSVGMDINWPFGASILEPVFKTYKQKELLEDAVIIYRVQRAPERRIFYIDTGSMPPNRAKAHIEQIKNEIHQRRIPNRTGGGACLDMATEVPLLDGRILSISAIAEEFATGKENWAYSVDPQSGQVVPGKITWAGKTRHAAKVVRLTLDTGDTMTVTPDHHFPVVGRGKTRACDIVIGVDSLISFHQRRFMIDERNRIGKQSNDAKRPQYEQVYDHRDKRWNFTHRMVANYMKSRGKHREFVHRRDHAKKSVIHHEDFNKYNNAPSNLAFMNGYDHFLLHGDMSRKFRLSLPEAEKRRLSLRHADGSKEAWAREINSQAAGEIDKLCYDRLTVSTLEGLIKHFGFTGWVDLIKHHGRRIEKPSLAIKVDHQLLAKIVAITSLHADHSIVEISHALSSDAEFMALFEILNAGTKGTVNRQIISQETLKNIVKRAGFAHWTDFKEKLPQFNHKVVAIEYLAESCDVGTLTIDGPEELHDFHTFALKSGVFTNNSMLDAAYSPLGMLEDYYFAQSGDGRGSKVETLPGGEMTGEIGDLLFFSKKLARGLRVPSSYLSLGGEEDAGATYNDGKLGAAMIQEFRFTKYCMRIQSLLAPIFDKEFKRFLRANGIEIDDSLFDLQFLPPQNFTKYRQIELDAQQVQVYTQLQENKKLSERFKLKRFLNLTDDELLENEKLWSEENAAKLKKSTGGTPAEDTSTQDLGAVGIRSGGGSDFDMGGGDPEGEMPPEGGAPPPDAGADPGAGGAPPPSGGAPPPAGGPPPAF